MTIDGCYREIVDALKKEKVIPFLGSGINYQPDSNLEITLASKLIGDLQSPQELMGSPSSICYEMPNERPFYCPLLQKLENGSLTCPLARELQLAVSKMTVRCLAEYKLTRGGLKVQNFYDLLRELILAATKERSYIPTPNKVHEFIAKFFSKRWPVDENKYPLIFTTSYDELLEEEFENQKQKYDRLFYEAESHESISAGNFAYQTDETDGQSKPSPLANSKYKPSCAEHPVIIKLYGTESHNFVVTERHHVDYLVGTKLPEDLSGHFSSTEADKEEGCHFLFLGYSPNDPELQIIIHRFCQSSRGESLPKKSWLIHHHQLPSASLENTFWNKYKVELIHCQSSLEDFISQLKQELD